MKYLLGGGGGGGGGGEQGIKGSIAIYTLPVSYQFPNLLTLTLTQLADTFMDTPGIIPVPCILESMLESYQFPVY